MNYELFLAVSAPIANENNFNKIEVKDNKLLINDEYEIPIEYIKYHNETITSNPGLFNEMEFRIINNNILVGYTFNYPVLIEKLQNNTFKNCNHINYIYFMINKAIFDILPEFNLLTGKDILTPVEYNRECIKMYHKCLYPYQIENVNWMLQTEMNVFYDRNTFTVNNLYDIKLQDGLFYNIYDCEFSFEEKIKKVKYFGGYLCDEMGLGKTVTSIMLCLNNRISEDLIFDIIPCKKNNESNNLIGKIKSKATLIIVPNTIVKQWADEIIRYNTTTQDLKILIITGKIHFFSKKGSRYSMEDFMNADFIIVNNRIFNSTYYDNFELQNDFKLDNGNIKCNNKNINQEFIWNLHDFYWRRIIIDEAHEVMSNVNYEKVFLSLNSIYKWGLSGTLMNNDSRDEFCNNVKKFVLDNIPSFRQIKYNKEGIQIFRTNTKESVASETQLNKFKILEELHKIKFIPIERQIYLNRKMNQDYLIQRKFCCSPFEVNGESEVTTFEEYLNKMDRTIIEEIDSLQTIIKMYKKEKNTNEAEVKKIENDLQRNISIRNYNETIKDILTKDDPIECIICLDVIQDITITLCQHMFCSECITGYLGESNNLCPTCRKPIKNNELIKIQKDAPEEVNEINPLTKQYGSKIAYFIVWIKKILENKKNKILIFIEWTDVLLLIQNVLNEMKINNIICKGTAMQRARAIDKFNQGGIGVIMLSSKYSCSGSNLTSANHIAILNPIGGSAEDRIAIESQAIARVHRIGQKHNLTVSRFIIENTIEEELYTQSKIDIETI